MDKFRLVFLPFLCVFISLNFGYTALRWLVDIKLELVVVDESILDFFLPIILSVISVFLVTRKRFRALEFKNDRSSSFLKMIMAVAVAIPLVISQSLISSISYDLIKLNTHEAIPSLKHEKFFDIKEYPIDPDLAAYDVSFRVRGKHNEDFNMYLSIAVPIDLDENIWYGIRYYKQISNRLEPDEKEQEYRHFLQDSEEKFNQVNYYDHQHLELLKKSDLLDGFRMAIEQSQPMRKGEDLFVLYPRKESLAQSNDDMIYYTSLSSIIAMVVVVIISCSVSINSTNLSLYRSKQLDDSDATSQVFRVVTFRAGCPVTTISILVCLIVFSIGVATGVDMMNGNTQELMSIGGVRRDLILQGEYWRVFSAVFVHAGLSHIAMNIIVLGFAGRSVESHIGSSNFIMLFIICALGSSFASISWYENTLSVGISGVNFGLIGALVALLLTGYVDKGSRSDLIGLVMMVLVSGAAVLFLPNIDHAAHLGGLVSGMLFTLLMTTWLRKPMKALSTS
ncbi:rhomboid family intramembrane serine protease [Vibrio sp. ZSDE26]|uniref:Rhomboid family intramembrane serine protease n=1 Tax=Vibrio amylolyticus TaxID=2847292 RepID=A0A9X1XM61_9VIBR|nr:rhomboid family intramembrane serine protease [Vibrio amylolyticus]MCK6264378.1 rhomboid family intramembrane serine protease [Vibrio amylolyticus]